MWLPSIPRVYSGNQQCPGLGENLPSGNSTPRFFRAPFRSCFPPLRRRFTPIIIWRFVYNVSLIYYFLERLHYNTDRQMNGWCARFLCLWPFFHSIKDYYFGACVCGDSGNKSRIEYCLVLVFGSTTYF